ncbi:phage terminase small subunit P27 family, partial [Bacillus paranthracis]
MDKGLNERKPPTHLKKVGKDTWIRIWSVLEGEGKADINDPIVVEAIAFSYQ